MRSIVGCLRFRIKRDTLVSLVDRLESDLQAAGKPTTLVQNILEVLTRHVAEVWGAAPPRGYSLPDMEGKPFCIFASGNEGPVLSPNPMLTVPGGPHGLPVGYAGLANPSTLADPLPHGLGWQLVYTGKTSEGAGRGLPIYWIVEYQDDTLLQHRTALRKAAAAKKTPQPALRVALTAIDQRLGTETFVVVGCADYGEITKHPPESSPAAWTLVAWLEGWRRRNGPLITLGEDIVPRYTVQSRTAAPVSASFMQGLPQGTGPIVLPSISDSRLKTKWIKVEPGRMVAAGDMADLTKAEGIWTDQIADCTCIALLYGQPGRWTNAARSYTPLVGCDRSRNSWRRWSGTCRTGSGFTWRSPRT